MQVSTQCPKQASSFEQLLNDFKVSYQLHDNVTEAEKAIGNSFSDNENDYTEYQEKPVTDWLSQIEQMTNESCQVNID